MLKANKVYLSFGRHGRYGRDTAIDRRSMLEAWLMGRRMNKELPNVDIVYHSPIPRAEETARFRAKGLGCSRMLSISQLSEEAPTFVIRKFVNAVVMGATSENYHYHFVTHLPVIEKLGLPILGAGEICICEAENWSEMLADNFKVRCLINPIAQEVANFIEILGIGDENLLNMSPEEIEAKIVEYSSK